MKLIKNKRALRRFLLNEVCGVSKWNIEGQPEPKEYPCYAYTIVLSFGYEEEQPNYLYARDIEKMRKALSPNIEITSKG